MSYIWFMSRTPYVLSEPIKNTLKRDVIQISGELVNTLASCTQLSKAIYKNTQSPVSARTLLRIFKIDGDDHSPSKNSLDLLAQYCGYEDIIDYSNQCSHPKNKDGIFEFQILKDIYALHFAKDKFSYRDPGLFSITKNIVTKLRRDLNYYDSIAPYFSKDPIASTFFIEQFVDYDLLVHHYHKSVRVYISANTKDDKQIFGYCMLYQRAFLTKKVAESKHLIEKINTFQKNLSHHPFILGRLLACNLLHNTFILKKDNKELLSEILGIEKYIPRSGDSYVNFPGFHFVLCDALLQCDLHHEANIICDIALKEFPKAKENADTDYMTTLHLFKAMTSFKTGNNRGFKKHMKIVEDGDFHFQSHKYYTIQKNKFLIDNSLLSAAEKKKLSKTNQTLISQTGFTRFG
ncbi:MAG: hypothetical protein O3A15_06700 [Proteobacteria bacterium]|nr:hypothetical protein [Pseudomonadota bacterium]